MYNYSVVKEDGGVRLHVGEVKVVTMYIVRGVFRLCGIHVIQDDEPAWFPAEELREYYAVVPHKVSLASLSLSLSLSDNANNLIPSLQVTPVERKLFCIREDGSEGLCCPINGPPQENV